MHGSSAPWWTTLLVYQLTDLQWWIIRPHSRHTLQIVNHPSQTNNVLPMSPATNKSLHPAYGKRQHPHILKSFFVFMTCPQAWRSVRLIALLALELNICLIQSLGDQVFCSPVRAFVPYSFSFAVRSFLPTSWLQFSHLL